MGHIGTISIRVPKPLSRRFEEVMLKMDLDYYYNGHAVVFWMATVVIIAIIASLWPAHNATRVRVRESLTYA